MDEVDDTRTTLKYCVEEVIKTNAPAAVLVTVVHNKLKDKATDDPTSWSTSDCSVEYVAAEDVPDKWNCYPWDAGSCSPMPSR